MKPPTVRLQPETYLEELLVARAAVEDLLDEDFLIRVRELSSNKECNIVSDLSK